MSIPQPTRCCACGSPVSRSRWEMQADPEGLRCSICYADGVPIDPRYRPKAVPDAPMPRRRRQPGKRCKGKPITEQIGNKRRQIERREICLADLRARLAGVPPDDLLQEVSMRLRIARCQAGIDMHRAGLAILEDARQRGLTDAAESGREQRF